MKNKELIKLITELKQQLYESRDTDFDNYVGKLSKRASKVIIELEVNNVVSDDAIKCKEDCELKRCYYDKHDGFVLCECEKEWVFYNE